MRNIKWLSKEEVEGIWPSQEQIDLSYGGFKHVKCCQCGKYTRLEIVERIEFAPYTNEKVKFMCVNCDGGKP
jgi:hypothetical protein